jgi:hypothetical protein
MSKHLSIQPSGSPNWRLPAETNLEVLLEEIESAMEEGRSVRFEYESRSNPLHGGTVVLNCRALSHVTVFEVPDSEPMGPGTPTSGTE